MTDMLPLDVPARREPADRAVIGGHSGATFSACSFHPHAASRPDGHCSVCGRCLPYRYNLWRCWGDLGGIYVAWYLCNPSTADARDTDPTASKCIKYSKAWGYDGFVLRNGAAYRATDPDVMKAADDPFGPENAYWLRTRDVDPSTDKLGEITLSVVGWGKNLPPELAKTAASFIPDPYALHVNGDGSPKHPLYIRDSATPVRWMP